MDVPMHEVGQAFLHQSIYDLTEILLSILHYIVIQDTFDGAMVN